MANKKEDKDKKYLLQDGDSIEEYDEIITKVFDTDKDDPEEITKAVKDAKDEESVTFGDGTVSVRSENDSRNGLEEDDINEYQETEGFHFDKLQVKGPDEKKFLEFLQAVADGKVDISTVSLGPKGDLTVQKAHYDPSLDKKGKILTSESFQEMVNNFGKINLSESEIMSILEETQNPRITKSSLIETIQEKIISEANMDDSVRRKFESGESDYSGHLDPDTVRNMANQVFGNVQRAIREKTGRQNVNMMDIQMLLGQSLMGAVQKEQRIGIPVLEQKAIEMIRDQFNIPEDAVDFQAEITGLPQMGGRPIQKGNLQYSKGTKRPPQGKTEEELKPQVTRRRLTNALMHGAARKSQNLHHMSDELREMDPSLNRDYGNIMAANDAMYWMMSDESIKEQGRSGVHAGNVRLDLSGEKPKIIAQGVVFPILLHELSKGVLELMSLWSLPKDKEVREYVTDKTDHLDAETNDIRLGQHLWSKFVEQIPVDNQEVISLTYNMLQQLPDSDFNSIMDGLANDRDEAKNRVKQLAEDAIEELRGEDYEEAIDQYSGAETRSTAFVDDVDTMLGGGEEPHEDQPEEIDYSSWSKPDLQRALDDALDAGDMDLVRKIGQYLR